jgi:hypothetical protein
MDEWGLSMGSWVLVSNMDDGLDARRYQRFDVWVRIIPRGLCKRAIV